MKLNFVAMDTEAANAFRNGALDANGQPPEKTVSDGDGNPCRHCQKDIPVGKPMLILSYRPFSNLQPYAETGPIFLCGDICERYDGENRLPQSVTSRETFLVRAYDMSERIIGGTGKIVNSKEISAYAGELLAQRKVAAVHIRSSSNNCYFGAIKRAE